MEIVNDAWQDKVLNTKGNILLMSGRRVGKSHILAVDCAEQALRKPNQTLLVISHTERQAYWLFERIFTYLRIKHPKQIKMGRDKPTKSKLTLTNHTRIFCLPTGMSGAGLRGIDADVIYPDECDYIEEPVWQAITPMLLTTSGVIRAGTTPNPSKEKGYVYHHMEKNPNFTVFNISTEDVMNNRPISASWTAEQRQGALAHLESEKRTMTKLAYACEYLGQRIDNLKRFFPDELIQKVCTLTKQAWQGKMYLGVDVARMGSDSSSYQILTKVSSTEYRHVDSICTERTKQTDNFDTIISLQRMYKFRQIGIDAGSGGLGVSLMDFLLREPSLANKVVALTNQRRSLDQKGERKTTMLKEDMYHNLKAMMEHGYIQLLNDDEVKLSLASVQYDVQITPSHKTQQMVFSHINSDIVEALIRAAQLAFMDKHLNLWIDYVR